MPLMHHLVVLIQALLKEFLAAQSQLGISRGPLSLPANCQAFHRRFRRPTTAKQFVGLIDHFIVLLQIGEPILDQCSLLHGRTCKSFFTRRHDLLISSSSQLQGSNLQRIDVSSEV
jgi:hypothetical protein